MKQLHPVLLSNRSSAYAHTGHSTCKVRNVDPCDPCSVQGVFWCGRLVRPPPRQAHRVR